MITIEQFRGILANSDYELVQCEPNDSLTCVSSIAHLRARLGAKHWDALQGFENRDGAYYPVFAKDVQGEWDASYDAYINDKSAWCAKYGCN